MAPARLILVSATAAPVLLIGGWTVAATRQPAGFNPVVDTISALAGRGATDRWLMTSALVGVGICHIVTALGLRPAARAGRVLYAVAGAATLLVAAFPLPRQGTSTWHTLAAAVSFVALAVWPVLAVRWRTGSAPATRSSDASVPWGTSVPWGLRPTVAIGVCVILLALVCTFGVELYGGGDRIGLAERMAAGAEAVWPLIVVASWRALRRR